MHEYGTDFYRFLASFAVRSAQRVVPELTAALPVRSVVDFGCGQGAWLSVWATAGATVVGVDGSYIDRRGLLIDPGDFYAADLAAPINLGRQFDLVQSLEVAEHLPGAKAAQFVDTLTAHGACVLFSAAVPGQGGENHVNEQPLGYWRAIFRERRLSAPADLRRRGDRALVPLQHDAVCQRRCHRIARRAGAVALRARSAAARRLLAALLSAAPRARQAAAERRREPHFPHQRSRGSAPGRAIRRSP
ncbi:MAG: methyltransferase domain-containing protein [Alphaproteobacteria bacterium]|nr:MAG: methyltransferase domain-containing protein [Alphaproteobacteria bacterium]